MPADRHHEGLMMSMSVRENTALTALERLGTARFVSRRREVEVVGAELDGLNVKAATLESPITSLSGGNQQKIVMARSLLSKPDIVLADEPTQGVDVGARAEIYRILREVSDNGVPVVVASSDAKELEGLCDRVIVLSRGHVVASLVGDEVTEERMIRAAVESTTHTREVAEATTSKRRISAAWRRRIEGDYAPGPDPRRRDGLSGRLHLHAERPLPAGVQHHLGDAPDQRPRLHRPRPDGRADDRRHRPVRRSAGRFSGGGRLVLPHRRRLRHGDGGRSRADGVARGRDRPGQRVADPVRQVHPCRRDPGDVHRPAGVQLPAARHLGRPDRPRRHRRHHHHGRAGARCRSSRSW